MIFSDGNFVEKNKRLYVFVQKGSNVTEAPPPIMRLRRTLKGSGSGAFASSALTSCVSGSGDACVDICSDVSCSIVLEVEVEVDTSALDSCSVRGVTPCSKSASKIFHPMQLLLFEGLVPLLRQHALPRLSRDPLTPRPFLLLMLFGLAVSDCDLLDMSRVTCFIPRRSSGSLTWNCARELITLTDASAIQAEFKTSSARHACLGVVDGCTIVWPKHSEIISALLLIFETSKKVFGDNCLALIDFLRPAKSLDASGIAGGARRAASVAMLSNIASMNVLILESLMSCREPMTSSRSKRNLPVNDGADISKDNVLAIGECSRHARIVGKWSSSSFNPKSKLHSGQSSRSRDTCLLKGRRDQVSCKRSAFGRVPSPRPRARTSRQKPTRALQRVTRGVLGQIGDSISEVRLESWISTRLPDPG
ncbi:hypothetical protein KCU99_g73, partial [Aureobasidium melanogenum]